MTMDTFSLIQGESPLLLSMPHPGTGLPDEVAAALNERGKAVEDTDWHMRELYAFAEQRWKPSIIEAKLSRYVIDLNRDPLGVSLYPGQATTELVPTCTFDGAPIWNVLPDAAEIERRKRLYFEPYHAALTKEIERIKALRGFCLLYDCHSIRSRIPRLFRGKLPILNLGTNSGVSCAKEIRLSADEFAGSSPYSAVVDGRFKGGWITRHYGRPSDNVHAVQMEIAQRAYLHDEKPPWTFHDRKARKLQWWVRDVIQAMMDTVFDLQSEQ
jgi:N-formylglutamate deformylase